MKITSRIGAAWRALTGQRSDPYAATYGAGGTHGFAGGAINRLTASLATFSGSVNADLDGALPVLRARARHLAANNEHGKRFLSLVATNVVGRQNPRLQVRAMKDQRNPLLPTVLDKAANDTVERHWERWGQTCDIANRHKTLYSLLRTTVKGVARDGEALIRVIRDKKLPYGMALQLLEADRLDDAFNAQLDNGNTIRQGVEVDSTLRAVAYYIKTAHPGENYAVQRAGTERVPAGDIYHLFTPERAEQVRGITWFHAVILRGSVIHAYEEAAVIAAQIGASKVAALERSDDSADMGPGAGMADGMSGGLPQFKVEAGEMFELPPGYKLSSWNPDYPHANFESFLKACLRGLAAGMDVAAHNLTGDMTEVNYSSARIAELNEREMWMVLQDWLITSFVQPLYEEWLAINLLTGKITFEMSGKALPADRYEKFRSASRFQGRRWAWVDPAKEADANAKLLETGLTSRTRLAAEQGEEFDDILDELAAEKIAMEAAGLMEGPEPESTAPQDPEESPEVLAAKAIAAGNVRAAELNRDAAVASQPQIHVHQGAINVATPEVRVDNHIAAADPTPVAITNQVIEREQPAPVINFAPTTNVAAPEVTVEVDAIMPAVSEVAITALPIRKTTTEILRDQAGDIATSVQVETDA
jgi:lambda family phage portal protein